VIPETDSLRIKNYIPDGNDHRRYGNCKRSDSDRKQKTSAVEIVFSLSEIAIKPEASTRMWIYQRVLNGLPICPTRMLIRARFEGIRFFGVWTSLSRSGTPSSVDV
jgi:hypothetical protein